MSDNEWPEPLGHKALQTAALLPENGFGVTREARLETQIIELAEEYDEKVNDLKAEVERMTERNEQLRLTGEAEAEERERLLTECISLRKELDDLKKIHVDARDDYREKETFYKDFIQRLDNDEGGQSDISMTNTLRSEFEMKEKDLTIATLTRKSNRQALELEAMKGNQGGSSINDSLSDRNEKLQQEIEQLEGFVATQQSLRKEAQTEALKLTGELNKMKSSVDNSVLDRLHEAESRAKEAVSREALLQAELADSQRRGIAAQRLVDDLRGQLADSGATPATTSSSDADLRKEFDKSLTECASLKENIARLKSDLEVAQKANSTSASRIQDIEKTHHDKIMTLEHDYASAKSLLEVKANDLAAVRAQLSALELRAATSASLEAEKVSLSQQLDTASTEISQMNVTNAAAASTIDGLKKSLSDIEKERLTEQEVIASTRELKEQQLQEITESKDGEIREQQQSISQLQSRVEVLMSELEKTEEHLDTGKTELESCKLTNVKQETELEALREKVAEQEGDSEWLQNEVAKARGVQAKQEAEIKSLQQENETFVETTGSLKDQLSKLKLENRRLIGDLRGDGGSGAALIPLPDHRGLQTAEVVQMLRVGLKSCSDITASLEKITSPSPSSNDECAFLLALCNKLRRMLSSTKSSSDYSQLQAAHTAVEKRALSVIAKVRTRDS